MTGHIDGTGTICEVISDEIAIYYSIKAPEKIMHYIVEKVLSQWMGSALPLQKRHRPLLWCLLSHIRRSVRFWLTKRRGDKVNLENDCIGKYIEHFLNWKEEKITESKITKEFLFSNGF